MEGRIEKAAILPDYDGLLSVCPRSSTPSAAVVFHESDVYLVLDFGCTQGVTMIFGGKTRLCCTSSLTSPDSPFGKVAYQTVDLRGLQMCGFRTMKHGTLSGPYSLHSLLQNGVSNAQTDSGAPRERAPCHDPKGASFSRSVALS